MELLVKENGFFVWRTEGSLSMQTPNGVFLRFVDFELTETNPDCIFLMGPDGLDVAMVTGKAAAAVRQALDLVGGNPQGQPEGGNRDQPAEGATRQGAYG